MINFIYGKHCIEEFLKILENQRDLFSRIETLYFSSEENLKFLREKFKLSTSFSKIKKQKLNSQALKNLFKIKAFENEQGLVLKFKRDLSDLITLELEKLCLEARNKNKSLIWLPMVKDPQNVAALVRSAVSFGVVSGVILPQKGSPNLNPAFCKASAGSIFKSKLSFYNSSEKSLELFEHLGFQIVGISRSSREPLPQKLEEFSFQSQTSYLFVFGEEARGIPPAIVKKLKEKIFIGGASNFESLNLSVSAGIVLYEFSKIFANNSQLESLNPKNANS